MARKINKPVNWDGLLDPDVLRPNLIAASVYIAAFQMLKDGIVQRIKVFFTNGFDENGWRVEPEYQTEVLSRNPSPVYASLDWLKEIGALNDEDLAAFARVKNMRNDLSHTLATMVTQGMPGDFTERFAEMAALLDKVERWWIVNVEIPTDPDLNPDEIDVSAIIPGPVMGLRVLIDVALGSQEESKQYLEAVRKADRAKAASSA